jgi:hypothetical protein
VIPTPKLFRAQGSPAALAAQSAQPNLTQRRHLWRAKVYSFAKGFTTSRA